MSAADIKALVLALRHLVDELKIYNPGTVYAQAEMLLSRLEKSDGTRRVLK